MPRVVHRKIEVDDVQIFYREAEAPEGAPTLPLLVEGERTGRYRVRAGDLPIIDADGQSRISVADYAAAIADAVEGSSFVGTRFTAAY